MALALAAGLAINPAAGADVGAINIQVVASPLMVTIQLRPASAPAGRPIHAQVEVVNIGPEPMAGVTVRMRADPDGLVVRGRELMSIARLEPGRSRSVPWEVCAPRPGQYIVLAQATLDGYAIESPARLLTATDERPGGCT